MGTVPEEAEMCFFLPFLRCFAALKSKCLSHIQVNGLSEFGILCFFYQLCKVNQCDDGRIRYVFLLEFNLIYLNKNLFLLGEMYRFIWPSMNSKPYQYVHYTPQLRCI